MPFKKCLNCGKEIEMKIARDAKRKKFCSHNCRAKYYVKNGTIKLHRNSKGQGNPNPPKGKLHHFWKGGVVQKNGYKYIKVKSGKDGYLAEHRKIIEEFLGRKLKKDELIHHIDGNRLNNNIENLILCSLKEHFVIHNSLMKIGYMLVQKGQIKFNKQTKTYAIS